MFCRCSSRRSRFSDSGDPARPGNTSGPSPSPRAASRISTARPRQRDPVRAFRLHPHGRNGPYCAAVVDLDPLRAADLTPPGRRQHEKLQRQPGDVGRTRRPHPSDGRRHVLVRQRPHVLNRRLLRTEDRPDSVAWVVAAELHGNGPLQNRPDSLAHSPRGLRLHVPDRREHVEHLGASHL